MKRRTAQHHIAKHERMLVDYSLATASVGLAG